LPNTKNKLISHQKNLLGIENLTCSEIFAYFDRTRVMKEKFLIPKKYGVSLLEKTVVLFFVENSTRTRSSFELAAKRLSATTLQFSPAGSSVAKGETLLDTMRVLEAMQIDCVVMRHSGAGSVKFLADRCNSSFINAGDGAHEHPTQALLDGFTLYEKWGFDASEFKGKKIAIIGDITHSRVARSNIFLMKKLGAEVAVVAPPTLLPCGIEDLGVSVLQNVFQAIEFADVLMFLRIQQERLESGYLPSLGEFSRLFGLNNQKLKMLKENQIIMHPGPVMLGVELDLEAEHCRNSVILNQVQNGVATRMAILDTLLC